jgi:DNA-directed RNA polymerase specialized sigma24 family protein
MSIDDRTTQAKLERTVDRLTSDHTLRKDLMQEALIHLWKIQMQRPGQTDSWYLQNCRYHLQHYLSAGRSMDSLKRNSARVELSLDCDPDDALWDDSDQADLVREAVSARDLIVSLSKKLSSREQLVLHYLAEGLGPREIAKRLKVSHPMVIKYRRKIAGIVAKMASPERCNEQFSCAK